MGKQAMGIYVSNFQFRMVCTSLTYIINILALPSVSQTTSYFYLTCFPGYVGLCSILSPEASCYDQGDGAFKLQATSSWHCNFSIRLWII